MKPTRPIDVLNREGWNGPTPAAATNISKTFDRIRREQSKSAKVTAPDSNNVVALAAAKLRGK